jgi:recombination endonuclease VII
MTREKINGVSQSTYFYRANREHHVEQQQIYRKTNPWCSRESSWKQNGINIDRHRFLAMFAEQDGKCALCNEDITLSASVDHDHTTGLIRGLIHTSCNHMLGNSKDNPELLERGAAYLRRHLEKEKLKLA